VNFKENLPSGARRASRLLPLALANAWGRAISWR